jgi:integral membrane sensor domain MASE1
MDSCPSPHGESVGATVVSSLLTLRMRRSRYLADAGTVAALTAVYFVSGKLGLTLAYFNASASAVWPASGIALAALLVFGYRVWPGVFLGAFLVNITTAGSVATSLGIATGNTLEALVGAYLVNRFANGRHAFDRAQDVFRFAFLAGMSSTAVSATFGLTSCSGTCTRACAAAERRLWKRCCCCLRLWRSV